MPTPDRPNPWLALGRGLVRWMPLGLAAVVGHLFGTILWYLVGNLRRQTLANLERAYGERMPAPERRRTGRRSFALAVRGVFSWIVLHRKGRAGCLDRLEVVCDPELRDAMKRGAVLLTQHFGLFEVANPWLCREFDYRPVGASAKRGSATELLVQMRRDMGGDTIEQGNARELLTFLKSGGVSGMLIDQDIRRVNGIFVPFFGSPAYTPVGPATFAVRLKIPLIFFRVEWTSWTRHRLTFGPLLRAREDLAHDDAVLDLTARATAAGEEIIRARPDHWLWVHERWRTQPEDRPDARHWTAGGGGGGTQASRRTVPGENAGRHTAT